MSRDCAPAVFRDTDQETGLASQLISVCVCVCVCVCVQKIHSYDLLSFVRNSSYFPSEGTPLFQLCNRIACQYCYCGGSNTNTTTQTSNKLTNQMRATQNQEINIFYRHLYSINPYKYKYYNFSISR